MLRQSTQRLLSFGASSAGILTAWTLIAPAAADAAAADTARAQNSWSTTSSSSPLDSIKQTGAATARVFRDIVCAAKM
eukprot:gene31743-14515_t